MKIPSLSKLPNYKKFTYEPRYYDPVKEEIRLRTKEIQHQLTEDSSLKYRTNISRAFNRKTRKTYHSNMMQSGFVLLFVATMAGYIYFGPYVLYGLLILIPFYIFLKLRRRNY
jgi:hypothetical protein